MTTEPLTPEQKKTSTNFQSGWTIEDKKKIASVVFPVLEMQKQYGKEYDIKVLMGGWDVKLSHRYTVEQIIYAFEKYTDKRDDFPSPSNIIAILEPEEPEITEAEFIHASKYYKLNGYNPFSDEKDIIDKYKEQKNKKRESFKIENEKIKSIVSKSVKKLN